MGKNKIRDIGRGRLWVLIVQDLDLIVKPNDSYCFDICRDLI